MRVLIFLPRFVGPIQEGTKRQTIRKARRSHPIQPDDWLSLRRWHGKPYRSCQEEIIPAVQCEAVRPIRIRLNPHRNELVIGIGSGLHAHLLTQDGPNEVASFVRADGFACVSDFVDHWAASGVMAFEGVLIEWAERPGGGE